MNKEMTFKSQDSSPLISEGEHLVTVKSVYLAEADGNGKYKDKTAQLEIIFEADDGKKITRWFNLKGFQVDANEPVTKDTKGREVPNYLTDKKGVRVEDPDKTESCLRIIGQLGHDTGISAGEDFKPSELEGKQLGISVVRDDTGFGPKLRVAYTLPASRIATEAAEEVFAE